MHKKIVGVAVLCAIFLPVNSSSSADEGVSQQLGHASLQLRQFVVDVLDANPSIKAARMSLVAKRAVRDAGSQPLYNPDFTLSAEDSAASVRSAGISQTIDWYGKRKARAQIAEFELLLAESEFQTFRRSLVSELLQGLAQNQIGLERHAVVLERQELMDELANIAQSRLEAGDISQVDLDLVKLAASNARIHAVGVRAKQLESLRTIQSLTGPSFLGNWPSLPEAVPELPKNLDIEELVLQLPEVQLAKLSVQRNDSLTKLSRAERRPDPTVTLEGGKEDSEQLVGLSVTIPLFVRNSFRHEVDSYQAETTASELRADDVQHRARVHLTIATERLDLLRSALFDWETTSEKSLSRPVEQLQQLWEKGELTTSDYVVQLSETLSVRESALDLRESVWLAWFEWLLASGQIDAWLGVNP